jgi:DNA topoisomerase-1
MDNVESPEEKFESARRLCRKLPKVRSEYKKTPVDAQSAQFMVALFLIERCCIRVGNKKDEKSQGNTVGCCTLRAHTHLWVANESNRRVRIAFVGKDSIKYENTVALPNELFAIVLELLKAKKVGAILFDALSPGVVNRLLHERIMPGVTAKTFRTMRASMLFETVLRKSNDAKRANADVAALLNHKTHKGDKSNLQTSRNNYIDPRIYFAYRARTDSNELTPKGWFENHEHWAGNTPASFRFKK